MGSLRPLGQSVIPMQCLGRERQRFYKNELIHSRRWADVVEVEIATFEWVNWWND